MITIDTTAIILPMTEEEAIAEVLAMIDNGEVTLTDPEAASGNLTTAYYSPSLYTDGSWLNNSYGEIDIFGN